MTKPEANLSLEKVALRLDEAGIPWAVFAGAAASAYGATRPLTDVDLLVPAADGERVAALFPEARVQQFGDGCLQILLPDLDILAGLDWMDLDAEMAARLTRHEIAGVQVPVIPPEDNILVKARLGRGPEVGKYDWEDVEAMMASVSELDWDYLRCRARASLPPERRQQILRRLEQIWHRLHGVRVA